MHTKLQLASFPFLISSRLTCGYRLKLLEGHGWHRVAADTADVPVFAFTTRKGVPTCTQPCSGAAAVTPLDSFIAPHSSQP